ncbi:hypothetical protein FRC16_002728 [Serendipita sp. 398]|nr:hypothetical protein FRC16_002728 [Serendipita sp. 398]
MFILADIYSQEVCGRFICDSILATNVRHLHGISIGRAYLFTFFVLNSAADGLHGLMNIDLRDEGISDEEEEEEYPYEGSDEGSDEEDGGEGDGDEEESRKETI